MNNPKSSYAVDLPYPKVGARASNLEVAGLLLQDYAGAASELTATTSYIYSRFVLENSHPELATMLGKIAIVEMHHIHLLAQAITNLGVDPRFRTIGRGNDKYWSADAVHYSKTPNQILLEAIEGEKSAIDQYTAHIELIDDPDINALLTRIIQDEQLHLTALTKAFQELGNIKNK